MYIISTILLSLLSWNGLAAQAPPEAQIPLGLLESKPVPRPATQDDLDDFVTVYIDAFKPGPLWQYVYIDDDKYANYTWTCLRKAVQEQWEDLSARNSVNVIAVPNDTARVGERNETVVSIAAWAWVKPEDFEAQQFTRELHALHSKCSKELDVNVTRAADFERQFDEIAVPYIRDLPEPQLYLGLLATHPDWDGHGLGAAQVEVGLRKAARANTPVTLIATPAGFPLYDSLGFRSLANLTFVKLDNLGTLWEEYMRWDAKESFG